MSSAFFPAKILSALKGLILKNNPHNNGGCYIDSYGDYH